ncbi:hypothetical protein BV25DRAFT_1719063 [Artomyces pyxidatus]|uniref:Uncharacterized protein n=1 Tax=Artomyces pyxidatus TaxID=48021 RepID=A0ACB8SIJ1_9AGAM|nr:hypothetical protein BV25DRAFT_1719063 [Artomyces pyxidatus]
MVSNDQEAMDPRIVITVKNTDLWLKDGTIIIRTVCKQETTTQVTLYKVHKFVLALHCSVFAALFSAGPQDAFQLGSEQYENLPIMELTDVPDDVNSFLKALYFPEETQIHLPKSRTARQDYSFPATYPGILRLATKYDAPKIRNIIIRSLEMNWPTTPRAWETLQCQILEDVDHDFEDLGVSNVSKLYPDPVLAIRLATEFDLPHILPVAFYDLFRVLDSTPLDPPPGELPQPFRVADISILTGEDLRIFTLGAARLRTAHSQALHDASHISPLNTCERRFAWDTADPEPCARALSAWMRSPDDRPTVGTDPLGWLRRTIDDLESSPPEGVCDACVQSIQDKLSLIMEKLWKSLPHIFVLNDAVAPDWGVANDEPAYANAPPVLG